MLKSLTSFRFAAAFMVFICHTAVIGRYGGALGPAGVQFFFVLSGFILTYNYHTKFIQLKNDSILKFYKARFAKIYPVHLLTLVLVTPIVILMDQQHNLFMAAANLFLVQSFVPDWDVVFGFNNVSWTLSVEAFFYVTFPFLLWLLINQKVQSKIALSIVVLSVIWTAFFVLHNNFSQYTWILNIFPVARLFEFVSGMVLGLIFVTQFVKPVNKYLLSTLQISSLILVLAFVVGATKLHLPAFHGVYFVPVWWFLIYTFAFQGGALSKVFANKVLVYLGDISFSFYMIHSIVLLYINHFLGVDKFVAFLVGLPVTILLSSIIYKFYEEPLRKHIRFGFHKKQKTAPIVALQSIDQSTSPFGV